VLWFMPAFSKARRLPTNSERGSGMDSVVKPDSSEANANARDIVSCLLDESGNSACVEHRRGC